MTSSDGRDTRNGEAQLGDPKTGNKNLDLLIKLLNMTTSDNDNITLMSIRKANDQLRKFDASWETLLRSKVTMVADPFNEPFNGAAQAPVPSRAPPPMTPPSRPTPPPRPTPTYQSAPPPQPAPPPPIDPNLNQPNKYDSKCAHCFRSIPAGKGLLKAKDRVTGKWRVECGPNFGHNAPYSARAKRPTVSTNDINDLF